MTEKPAKAQRILLVDDNEELLYSLCRIFRNAGFIVTSAPDAETAIEGLTEAAPDVVMTDFRLPGRSGRRAERGRRQHGGTEIQIQRGHDARRNQGQKLLAHETGQPPPFPREAAGGGRGLAVTRRERSEPRTGHG